MRIKLFIFMFVIGGVLFAQQSIVPGRYMVNPETDIVISDGRITFFDLYTNSEKSFSFELRKDGVFNIISFDSNDYVYLQQYSLIYFFPLEEGKRVLFGSFANLLHHLPEENYTFYSVSSYLSETISGKRVDYNAEKLESITDFVPWADGVEGSGIGEQITLKMTDLGPSHNFALYNGYFDPQRLDLYYSNSRLKRAIISSRDFDDFEVTFQDIPDPQIIRFPTETYEIVITVLEVFEGEKYQDLCINAITRNMNYEVYPPSDK